MSTLLYLDKTARFHSKLDEKHEFSRGPLWGLVETAKELAFHRAHPGGYVTSNETKKKSDNDISSGSSSSNRSNNNNKMVNNDKKSIGPKVKIIELKDVS